MSNENLSDFEQEMLKYTYEDDYADVLDAIEIPPEIEEPEFSRDDFINLLERASTLVQQKGKYVGLCLNCLGTGYLRTRNSDGYDGIAYRVEGENVEYLPCSHGIDRFLKLSFKTQKNYTSKSTNIV
jgi:hypothetical protein